MAHKIEEPWDKVLSVEGTEWHGLATHVEAIGTEEVKPLLFDIVESPCFVKIGEDDTYLEDYKVLVADHRACRPDLPKNQQLVPLHIPKNGYRVIPNSEIWECMEKSLKDLNCKVTSVCTLERGKKFAISCTIGDADSQVINKDKFQNYLNFLTSHDGTIAMEAFDTSIRTVCMNTFQASRGAAGDTSFKVYHTKNASFALSGLSDLLNAILKGRIETKEVLEYLATCKVDANDALAMASGYFAETTETVKLSTRSWNAATEIATLFSRGIGNKGENLYDLFNGATEYWTSGGGTGASGATPAQRIYRSALGQAATHKVAFLAMLADDTRRKDTLALGRDAVALHLKA
jgi:Domain of unknown function (DUF932)